MLNLKNPFKSNMKKAQSSVELVLLLGFMFLVFNVMIAGLFYRLSEIETEKELFRIDEINNIARAEIMLAHSVEDGYNRIFYLPQRINGLDYNIRIVGQDQIEDEEKYGEIIAEYVDYHRKHQSVRIIPINVRGEIYKGENKIEKRQGVICLNDCGED